MTNIYWVNRENTIYNKNHIDRQTSLQTKSKAIFVIIHSDIPYINQCMSISYPNTVFGYPSGTLIFSTGIQTNQSERIQRLLHSNCSIKFPTKFLLSSFTSKLTYQFRKCNSDEAIVDELCYLSQLLLFISIKCA